jgi:hypothetical protein
METAFGWWCELPDKWTPVGWKDHLFRFNVLFNGMISAVPDTNSRASAWRGQGAQLGIWPSAKAELPGHVSQPHDNGAVVQGWRDCDAPVLWSEWAREGLLLREEVFAHVPGGRSAETGVEPLFAWVRLSVHDVLPALPAPDRYGFNIKINAPYISVGAMSIRYNIAWNPEQSAYPRRLAAAEDEYYDAVGLRIAEPDGRIRLAISPGQECAVEIRPDFPTERDFLVFAEVAAQKGTRVDLLLPMLPTDRPTLDQELSLGYDAALEEANRFWGDRPDTAAHFGTPEAHINDAIRHNLRSSEVIAERDPATGRYSMLTGSWAYADQWATPASMNCAMLLDTMGHHGAAEKYLQVYVDEQGRAQPESRFFSSHPGLLAPPRGAAATDWTSDHGAILWALAEHLLLAGETSIADSWTAAIEKACEYVRDARRATGHDGVAGIMPPGVATDMPTKIQSVWADAWAYKGLSTAVRWLRRSAHRRAEEFAAEAADYKQTFVSALRAKTRTMPVWKDADGQSHHLVPMALSGEQAFEYRNAFYLDTGPLVLVFAGLLDADDEPMKSSLLWFRQGPPAKVYRYDSDCWQVPSLPHEISSCEPCYSWNVFHSHQSGDRLRYLEGMYSLFAGAISRQTFTACETRGGVTGVTGAQLPAYLARLAVIDDQLQEGRLHLLRFVPLAWLRGSEGSTFEGMPTEFGPVTVRARLAAGGKELEVEFEPRFRIEPQAVMLHLPPVEELKSVVLNGIALDWDRSQHAIEIG